MSRRFCFALDLKDDPALIAEYRKCHKQIWPEITQALKDTGIEDMEIYLPGMRTFMILKVKQSFSFEKKTKGRRAKSEGVSLGAAHVEIPENIAGSKSWRKMAAHVAQ